MTLTNNSSPETAASLNQEAEAEAELFADWEALSMQAFWGIWDNDQDAIYDTL